MLFYFSFSRLFQSPENEKNNISSGFEVLGGIFPLGRIGAKKVVRYHDG